MSLIPRRRRSRLAPFAAVAALVFSMGHPAHAVFNITVNFDSSNPFTTSQQAIFAQAESFWESIIVGYKPGVNLTGLTITASAPAIDGVGSVLGQAGPQTGTTILGSTFALTGLMEFDSADVNALEANGTLDEVILHEMAHVIGFGTLWTLNGLYIDGTGQYTGQAALAAYRQEFVGQENAAFVPVELGGGEGTANGHWDEVNGGGSSTGVADVLGRDRRFELMTGWLNAPGTYVSNTTRQQFVDLGYQVASVAVVPEPGTGALGLLGLGVLGAVRRRHRLR